jgi:hypothetical protein
MASSEILRRVALAITDVSEELSTIFFRVRWLLVAASVFPSSPILVTLMKEELSSSETSVLTRATWRNIPEDAILHSHHCENFKSYIDIYVIIERVIFLYIFTFGKEEYSHMFIPNELHLLLFAICFILASFLAYYLVPAIGSIFSFEKSFDLQQTTRGVISHEIDVCTITAVLTLNH